MPGKVARDGAGAVEAVRVASINAVIPAPVSVLVMRRLPGLIGQRSGSCRLLCRACG
jgi:hypothetical protein